MEEEQRDSTGRVDGQAAQGPSPAADRPRGSAPLGERARRATSLAGCGTPAAAGARLRAQPSSHLRFKGDSVTPVESSALGLGGERSGGRAGDEVGEEVLGNNPRWNICQTSTHTHFGNLVRASWPVATAGARRGLPPAASPGRRGAQQIRPVLNFTAP